MTNFGKNQDESFYDLFYPSLKEARKKKEKEKEERAANQAFYEAAQANIDQVKRESTRAQSEKETSVLDAMYPSLVKARQETADQEYASNFNREREKLGQPLLPTAEILKQRKLQEEADNFGVSPAPGARAASPGPWSGLSLLNNYENSDNLNPAKSTSAENKAAAGDGYWSGQINGNPFVRGPILPLTMDACQKQFENEKVISARTVAVYVHAMNNSNILTKDERLSFAKTNFSKSFTHTLGTLTPTEQNQKLVPLVGQYAHNMKGIVPDGQIAQTFAKYFVEGDAKNTDHNPSYNVLNYYDLVNKYAAENDLDPAFVLAIIHCESRGNPNAGRATKKGGKDALHRGLMQMYLGSAKEGGVDLTGKSLDELYKPETNIMAGTGYIRFIKLNRVKVDDERLQVSAYLWGGGDINKYIRNKAKDLKLTDTAIEMTPTAVKEFVEKLNPTQREELIQAVLNTVVDYQGVPTRIGDYSDKVLARKREYEALLKAINGNKP